MDFNDLQARYAADDRVRRVADALEPRAAHVHVPGAIESARSMLAAAVFGTTPYHHVFVLNDNIQAAYFQNDLRNLLTGKEVFFFPDSFKKSGRIDEINAGNVQLRTEAINRMTHPNSRAELMVTYPEALFEKVVQREVLRKNMLQVRVGESLDVDFLMDVFTEYGFSREDFVYEPGQFSVRGDIVDIFSFGNELPYRIELFDDEVESIRSFDPITQRSDRKIASITIVPNMQTHFRNDEKASLFDVLDAETVFWVEDVHHVVDVVERNMQTALEVHEKLKDDAAAVEANEFLQGDPRTLFERPADLMAGLDRYRVVEWGQTSFYEPDHVEAMTIKPQPSFNRNFDLLISDLNDLAARSVDAFLFSENQKQMERFHQIFADLDAEVAWTPVHRAIHAGFIDEDAKVACYTDHQIFNRYHKYSVRRSFSKDKALILKTLKELQPGDYVTHIDHGVGKYSGLEKVDIGGKVQEMVRIIYRNKDLLYVGINSLHKISKYSGKEGAEPTINKLGSDTWSKLKRRTKRKIKDIAEDLIKLYAKRKSKSGHAYPPDNYLQRELEASFIYEDTPDQEKATADVKRDMEAEIPMDRLICGDVGFGKTEVAIRAAFKAVADGRQAAVLVPTTILAAQHFHTFRERLADFPVTIDYVNRFRSAAEKRAIYKRVEAGEIDILIGTHAIVNKKVVFKDLGLLVVDEEQKFGVKVKDRLKELKVNVDTLTLTATPIPRTLQFSLMGARDLSVIATPPPNRQPVVTEVHTLSPEVIKEAIEFEVYRGGQVFFVHNRVKDLADLRTMIHKIVPDVDVAVAHGQLEGHALEKVMMEFIDGTHDVLLCTNIIETGLDIPNANTIIINAAHMFGLSDLHQLRGRVGRSNKKAFCYLFRPPVSALTQEARQRLKTVEEFADLGSGLNIALRDLDIRGAGNLLGGEQSGFISEIGYEMYHKILDEALRELKTGEFKDLYADEMAREQDFVSDSQIDTDLEMLIPDSYVNNINERMALYGQMNDLADEDHLQAFADELVDRFGPIPPQVHELFDGIRLKWLAIGLGQERLVLKSGKLRCFFPENQESVFYQSEVFRSILQYVQVHPENARLKQTEKYLILIFDDVGSMHEAMERLSAIRSFVDEAVEVG